MPIRKFIEIDEEKCDGCGNCLIACAEGALAISDGKARVVSENLCDGLGACIGACPQDALKIVDKDVAAFTPTDGQKEAAPNRQGQSGDGKPCCPSMSFNSAWQHPTNPAPSHACKATPANNGQSEHPSSPAAPTAPTSASALTHWPIQLGLINPSAPHFQGKKLLLAADCTAFAYGAFHRDLLAGAALVIACPKLDNAHELYIAKLATLIKTAGTGLLEVIRMEVPCCSGLTQIAREAISLAGVPCSIKETIVGIQGHLQ